MLRKEEFTSIGLKATLALEKERRKKAKVKVVELKDQTSRQILEAKIQAVKEFKVSSEMMDLNIAFSQEAFQKGYELWKDRVARKFPKLDLDFLYGDVSDEEAGPSAVTTDPYPTEAALKPSESTVEMPEPMLELDDVPEAPTSPGTPFESAEPALRFATTARVPGSSPISPPEIGGS